MVDAFIIGVLFGKLLSVVVNCGFLSVGRQCFEVGCGKLRLVVVGGGWCMIYGEGNFSH